MAAGDPILDFSDFILLATGGGGGAPETVNWYKSARVGGAASAAPVAGRITSLWRYDGMPGASSTNPTTAAVPTNATAGSMGQATSASGTKKRLLAFVAAALVAGTIIVYDRVGHQGGLSGTTTGAQTTNLPTSALTRYTTGAGVEPWLEIYTQVGTTATTATASYTDDGNTAGNATPTVAFGNTGLREAQRIIPLPLAAGDRGVRAVASVTLAASTLTAGAFGVTLAYPLVTVPVPVAGVGNLWSGLLSGSGPLDLGATSDACIALAWLANTTTIPELFGQTFFVEK